MLKHTLMAVSAVTLAAGMTFAVDSGNPAPAFTATDINGKTYSLSDFKGKIVVLESYNSDCPFVQNHYKSGAMQELQAEITSQGGIWLVVNSCHEGNPSYRKPDAAKKEWAAQKMKATAWIDDSSGKIAEAYGMRTTPHMFVIDATGKLAYQGAIDDKASSSGDPRAAKNYVRLAVQQLKAGGQPDTATTKPYGCGVKTKK